MSWVAGGVLVGGLVGWGVADLPGAVVGALAAGLAAAGLGPLRMRPIIVIPVIGGAVAGGLVGSSIVSILCRETSGGCPVWQLIGGLVTAIGAAVGIAVVVSLANRSLDEYQEAVDRRAAAGDEASSPPEEPAE